MWLRHSKHFNLDFIKQSLTVSSIDTCIVECCGGWKASIQRIILSFCQHNFTLRHWFLMCVLISIQFNWKLFYYFPLLLLLLSLFDREKKKRIDVFNAVCHTAVYFAHMHNRNNQCDWNKRWWNTNCTKMENVKHIRCLIFISKEHASKITIFQHTYSGVKIICFCDYRVPVSVFPFILKML